jgi:DNA-binding XRE family transcriptional regulator
MGKKSEQKIEHTPISKEIGFGSALTILRCINGMTQADLGKPISGENANSIANIENDIATPSLKTFKIIASILGVKLSDLIRLSEYTREDVITALLGPTRAHEGTNY